MRKWMMGTVAALGLGLAGLAGAQANSTQVYFSNDSGPASVVNVYVDGQKLFSNVFAADATSFPVALTPGAHTVVVTPNYLAPGVKDIVSQTVNVPAAGGTYTLALADSTDDASNLSGYSLSLDSGTPTVDGE